MSDYQSEIASKRHRRSRVLEALAEDARAVLATGEAQGVCWERLRSRLVEYDALLHTRRKLKAAAEGQACRPSKRATYYSRFARSRGSHKATP